MGIVKKAVTVLGKNKVWSLIGLLILIILGSIAELLGVSTILPFVNAIMDPGFIKNTEILNWISVEFGLNNNTMIIMIAMGLVVVFILKNVYLVFMNNQIYKFTYRNQRDLACTMMKYYMGQPYIKLREKNSAELIRNISSDSNKCFVVILNILQMSSELLVSTVLIVFLLITDYVVTLGVVIMLSLSLLLILRALKKRMVTMGKADREFEASMNKCVLEAFGGVKEVKITHSEKFFMNDYYYKSTMYAELHRKCDIAGLIPKQAM